MMIIRVIAAAAISFLACNSQASQHNGAPPSEQLHFSAEENGVHRPVPVPEEVLNILKSDNGVRNALEYQNISEDRIPASWFSASVVHLSHASKDLIVVGQQPLRGANVVTFWVFCSTPHGYKLALTAPAHDLIVRDKRWKGYREIELVAMTAVQLSTVAFRFDGQRYQR